MAGGIFPIELLSIFLNDTGNQKKKSACKKEKKVLLRFDDDLNLGGVNEEKDLDIIADNLDDFKESKGRNGTTSKCSSSLSLGD